MRIRTWSRLATVAVVSMMAASAFAQQPGGGRGRTGGFGGGGFGQPQSALSISQNAAVQKDASITEDQAAKLKTLNEEAQAKIRDSFSGFGNLRDLSDDERREKMAEMNAKRNEINATFKTKMSDILDAKQIERLDQIALQASGNQAYTDANVVKTLKITKEQQDKIAEVNKEFGDKRRELFPAPGGGAGGGGDFQERMAKMNELTKAQTEKLDGVLTGDQKSQLAKMKGKEFDVAQLRPQFGGGQGGPGRRGGGQGGNGGTGGGGDRPPRRPQ